MNLDRALRVGRELDAAEIALAGRQIAMARQAVRAALHLDPSDARARVLQAKLDLISTDTTAALGALDAHDLYHPQGQHDPATAFLRAEALCQVGADDPAQKLLDTLAEHYPDDVRPHVMLAALHLKRGLPRSAAAALAQVLRVNPDNAAARRVLASLLAESEPDEAVALVMRDGELAIDPVTLLWSARLYRGIGRMRDAEEQYRQLLAGAIDDWTTWAEGGTLADELGAAEVAQQRLQRAVALAPGGGEVPRAALALAQMHDGDFRRAGGTWLTITRKNSKSTQAWAGVLICAFLAGKERLVERAGKLLEVHASPAERRQMIAMLWQHAAVGQQINRIAQAQYDSTPRHRSRLRQMLQQAAATLSADVRNHPRRADTHYHLAVCHDMLERGAEAAKSVQAALTINPNYQDARRLADVLGGARAAA